MAQVRILVIMAAAIGPLLLAQSATATIYNLPPVAGWKILKIAGLHCRMSYRGPDGAISLVIGENGTADVIIEREDGQPHALEPAILVINGFPYREIVGDDATRRAYPGTYIFAARPALAADVAAAPHADFFSNSQMESRYSLKGSGAAVAAVQRCAATDLAQLPDARTSDTLATPSGPGDSITPGEGAPGTGFTRAIAKRAAPRGNPADWIAIADYPISAAIEEQSGISGVRLTIDATGRVSQCDVTQSSGIAALDDQTCRLLSRRGRFAPAMSDAGIPIGDSYTTRVRWELNSQFTYVDALVADYADRPAELRALFLSSCTDKRRMDTDVCLVLKRVTRAN